MSTWREAITRAYVERFEFTEDEASELAGVAINAIIRQASEEAGES